MGSLAAGLDHLTPSDILVGISVVLMIASLIVDVALNPRFLVRCALWFVPIQIGAIGVMVDFTQPFDPRDWGLPIIAALVFTALAMARGALSNYLGELTGRRRGGEDV